MAKALPSYAAARGSSGGGLLLPGKIVSGLPEIGAVSPRGLPRLCRCSRSQPPSSATAASAVMRLLRQSEDIDHASFRRSRFEVLDRVDEAERSRRIVRI